LETSFQLVSN